MELANHVGREGREEHVDLLLLGAVVAGQVLRVADFVLEKLQQGVPVVN